MNKPKPFLRWAGSKQKLLPKLSQFWNLNYNRYFEPFVGSGQLFFNVDCDKSVISDLNPDLIEVFNQIKKNPYPIHCLLQNYKVSEEEYYRIRSLNPKNLGINQRAARFIYLNRLCFNGLYRTNSKGQFNVPFNYSNPETICDYENLKAVSKKFEKTEIICGDFETVIKKNIRKNDFVYLDPPYAVENRRIFKQYGPQTFGIDDLNRISDLLKFIENKEAKFLLSYAYCKEAIDLFSGWKMQKTFVQRNISGFVKYRRKAAEVLVTNIENQYGE